MNKKAIRALIRMKQEHFRREEQQLFQINRDFYQGKFFDGVPTRNKSGRYGRSVPLGAVNLVFPLVETGSALMVGRENAIAANGYTEESEAIQFGITRIMDREFSRNQMRQVVSVCAADAMLFRRGIFKAVPDVVNQGANIVPIHPRFVGYDGNVRTYKENQTWTHCVTMPWRKFHKYVMSGVYARPAEAKPYLPEGVPEWAQIDGKASKGVQEVFGSAVVWEIYDMHELKVYHYHEATDTILLEDSITGHPFGMFSMNHNSENLDGLSEIELIHDQQIAANDFRSTLMQITYKLIPRMLFNSGLIDKKDLEKALNSAGGSFVGVEVKQKNGRTVPLEDVFAKLPMAEMPQAFYSGMSVPESDYQMTSGIAQQMRGVSANVRTSREMAVIQQAGEGRIDFRRNNLEMSGLVPMAQRSLYLIRKMRQGPHSYKAGDKKWAALSGQELLSFVGSFSLTPYSPLRNNPAIISEAIGQISNLLLGSRDANMREVITMVLEGYGISPSRALRPEEEVKAEIQAELDAQRGGPQQPPQVDQLAAAQDADAQADPADGMVDGNQLVMPE